MLEELTYFNTAGAVIIFIYGALIGSFLNVVIYRLPLERSIILPGSACGTCGTPLSIWENIPIFSYFFLRGRCKTCGSSYSARYALLEFITASAAVGLYYCFDGLNALSLYGFTFFCLLLVAFFTDIDHWIILDSISLGGAVVGLVGSVFIPLRGDLNIFGFELLPSFVSACLAEDSIWLNILSSLYGIVLSAGFYWAIQVVGGWIIRQEAMGTGDIKLAAMIGAFLGWHLGVVSFLLSFVLGAAVALVMMAISGKRGRDPIPLGTFMAISAFCCFIWKDEILGFVLNWPSYFY
ncbi:prepilin peptidase [bacterium]|nr:prepilin peptidase [bacterium]